MKIATGFAALCAALAAVPLTSEGQQQNASPALTLIDIVVALEKDYDVVTEIAFDDGVWEVEAFKGDMAYELAVHPRSGERLYEYRDYGEVRPPAGTLKLSEVVRIIEKAGYVQIDEISFERRNWEIEAIRDNQKREIHVDPATGEVVSDRIDD